LVYDITRKETFENITKWLEETKNYANESMTIVLVGNKTDLAAMWEYLKKIKKGNYFRREVKYEEGERFAKENNLLFFEASAKTAYNVDNVSFL